MSAAVPMLALAAALGAVITRLTVLAAPRLGAVSAPNPIVPQHTQTVAYLGGAAIAVAATLAWTIWRLLGAPGMDAADARLTEPAAIVTGAALFLALGVLDDLRPLSPAHKFVAEAVVATIPVGLGLHLTLTDLWGVDATVSVLLILVVINALNVTDVCDGLVGGISTIALVFYSLFGSNNEALALAVAGACAGFLTLNFPPAKIFLGDAGTHLLGFLLVSLVIVNLADDAGSIAPPAIALTLGVPLFELVFVTAVRTRKGLPWWRGSPDHYSLRLQAAGLSRAVTAVLSWVAAGLLCAAAWIFSSATTVSRVATVVAVLAVAAGCWRVLLRWEVAPATVHTEVVP